MNTDTHFNNKLDLSKAVNSEEQFGVKIFNDAEEIAKETFGDAATQIVTYSKKALSFIKKNPMLSLGAVAVASFLVFRLMSNKSPHDSASKQSKNLH